MGATYQLSVLQTYCAYRTISDEAEVVIVVLIRIDILVGEGQLLYDQ